MGEFSHSTTKAISSANDLLAVHSALLSRVRQSQQNHRRKLQSIQPPASLELIRLPTIRSPLPSPSSSSSPTENSPIQSHNNALPLRLDLPPAKRARVARYKNYVPEEETIRNDYSQRYVDGGEWPQNWVLGADPEHRFEEYPKQQRLLNLKKASVANYSLPPSYLSFSELNSLTPSKFDVILLDPPFSSSFTWDHLQELPIPALAADPSFVFLWVGSGAGGGLERGREVLAKWGYRRCEDVVWVKTNLTSNKGPGTDPPTTSLLTRTKQHCLIGIRGTVRRSTDSWFVHCNVDTDVIIWEGDPCDPTRKPPEMYTLIENFCLGIRRLEIFGRASSSIRRGWVTVLGQVEEDHLHRTHGVGETVFVDEDEGGEATKWSREIWETRLKEIVNGGKPVVPMTADIDALRPKSPFRPGTAGTPHNGPGGNNVGGTMGPGGVMLGMSNTATVGPRMNISGGNRGVFNPHPHGSGVMSAPGQNQLMGSQPMSGGRMGVNMNMHALGMEMGNGLSMEGMIGAWPGMMGGMSNMGGLGNLGTMGNMGIGNMPGLSTSGMGNIGGGMGMGTNNSLVDIGGMGLHAQPDGHISMNGMTMFNPAMGNMGWGEQGLGMDSNTWDDNMMSNMNALGMNMGGSMPGMGQWG
ncbi:MT-A70-domain-containing protein [Lentinula edodes]|uniref:MT-A70-domain-containing protein n=1 Tax=Lentinula lateritia TaxID=40482 RepID=A0A9W9AMT8_9AGAR|nr:MT-A70-domain-containing protein [Lentinula edodes]